MTREDIMNERENYDEDGADDFNLGDVLGDPDPSTLSEDDVDSDSVDEEYPLGVDWPELEVIDEDDEDDDGFYDDEDFEGEDPDAGEFDDDEPTDEELEEIDDEDD